MSCLKNQESILDSLDLNIYILSTHFFNPIYNLFLFSIPTYPYPPFLVLLRWKTSLVIPVGFMLYPGTDAKKRRSVRLSSLFDCDLYATIIIPRCLAPSHTATRMLISRLFHKRIRTHTVSSYGEEEEEEKTT